MIRIVLVIITLDQAIKYRIVHHTTPVAVFENLVRIAQSERARTGFYRSSGGIRNVQIPNKGIFFCFL